MQVPKNRISLSNVILELEMAIQVRYNKGIFGTGKTYRDRKFGIQHQFKILLGDFGFSKNCLYWIALSASGSILFEIAKWQQQMLPRCNGCDAVHSGDIFYTFYN